MERVSWEMYGKLFIETKSYFIVICGDLGVEEVKKVGEETSAWNHRRNIKNTRYQMLNTLP